MDNDSMDKNMIQNGPEKVKKNHYTKKDIRTAYIVLFIIFFSFLVLGFFMYKAMVPISWSRFNDKRIEKIEDTLKLDLDNAEPLSYRHVTAQDHIADFDFKVNDYKYFMENNFHGKAILSCTEADDKSSAEYFCLVEELSESSNKCFNVTFTKIDNGYKADLRCSRYVMSFSDNSQETTALE